MHHWVYKRLALLIQLVIIALFMIPSIHTICFHDVRCLQDHLAYNYLIELFIPLGADTTQKKPVEGHMKAMLSLRAPDDVCTPPKLDCSLSSVSSFCNLEDLDHIDYLRHSVLACLFDL